MAQKQIDVQTDVKEYMKQSDFSKYFVKVLVKKQTETVTNTKIKRITVKNAKMKRIKLVVNLCYHKHWKNFLPKEHFSKSFPAKYEYGFTRVVNKLDNCCNSLFYKTKNFCMTEWGAKVFFLRKFPMSGWSNKKP